jgi:hypothetical protein
MPHAALQLELGRASTLVHALFPSPQHGARCSDIVKP